MYAISLVLNLVKIGSLFHNKCDIASLSGRGEGWSRSIFLHRKLTIFVPFSFHYEMHFAKFSLQNPCKNNHNVIIILLTKYQYVCTKIQQTKMLVTCQRFDDLFLIGLLQFRQNIIKVGSKSWLLACSSNITLSLPSYTGSALKRKLNLFNGYLSLL